MDNDDAYISSPDADVVYLFTLGIGVMLVLLPTLIWLAMVLLRRPGQRNGHPPRSGSGH
ncbi:hypothetical protein [Nonomuraea sp. NPDC003709]|uniref:hypothetical protein n=1 Tax=Nonomuraea sp. NPDC003709 TaxID=3154450 RepID=UPI0033AAC37E